MQKSNFNSSRFCLSQVGTPLIDFNYLNDSYSPTKFNSQNLHFIQTERSSLSMGFPSPVLDRINLLFGNHGLHSNPTLLMENRLNNSFSPNLFPVLSACPFSPSFVDRSKKSSLSAIDVDFLAKSKSNSQNTNVNRLISDPFSSQSYSLPTWTNPHLFTDVIRRYAENAAQQAQRWTAFKETFMNTAGSLQSAPFVVPTTREVITTDVPSIRVDDKSISSKKTFCDEEEKLNKKTSDELNLVKPAFDKTIRIRQPKTHQCVYCGKLYSRKYGLKIHIRTHTGYKPLKCKVCGRPFGDPSNLNKHVRLHAKGQAPYKCDLCGKVLVRRRDLDRHMKSRHFNESKETEISPQSSSFWLLQNDSNTKSLSLGARVTK